MATKLLKASPVPLAVVLILAILGGALGASASTGPSEGRWRDLIITLPQGWRTDTLTPDQSSWSWGDLHSNRYKFLGFSVQTERPERAALEPGAVLKKLGPRSLAGRPATEYAVTFPDKTREYRLVVLNKPDQGGRYVCLMAGVIGLKFSTHWPELNRMIASAAVDRTGLPVLVAAGDAAAPTTVPGPAPAPAQPQPPAAGGDIQGGSPALEPGWKEETFAGLAFSLPGKWQEKEKSDQRASWGSKPGQNPEGAALMIGREFKPIHEEIDKMPLPVREVEPIPLAGRSTRYYQGNFKILMRMIELEKPLADGKRLHCQLSVIGPDRSEVLPLLERIMGTLKPYNPGQPGATPPPEPGWTQQNWEGISLFLPPGWIKESGSFSRITWQSQDKAKGEGTTLAFGLEKSTKPVPQLARERLGNQPGRFKELGPVQAAGHPARAYEFDSQMWVRALGSIQPEPDNRYLSVIQMVMGEDSQPYVETMDKILASIRPAPAQNQAQTTKTPPAKEQNRAYLYKLKSGSDYVGWGEELRPNGSADACFRVHLNEPGRTLVGFVLENMDGLQSRWTTSPRRGVWRMAVVKDGDLLSKRSQKGLSLKLAEGETVLELFVQDNNSLAGGKTNYLLTVEMSDHQNIGIPIAAPKRKK